MRLKRLLRHFVYRKGYILFIAITLTGCATNNTSKVNQDGPPARYVNYKTIPNAIPKKLPKSPYGNPASYKVDGKIYHVLKTAIGYAKRGIASWYGKKFHGELTSTHVPYNMFAMTAASPVLPIPCFVRVTNLANGKSVIVKVNDRGPFAENRLIDLSYVAAEKLGYARNGTALVEVKAIDVGRPESNQYHHFELANNKTYPQLFLQLGAFHDLQFAERLVQRAEEITDTKVEILKSDGVTPLYRVRVGPLAGVDESDHLHQEFLQLHIGKPVSVIQ